MKTTEEQLIHQLQRLSEIQEANTARMRGTVDEVRQLRALVRGMCDQLDSLNELLRGLRQANPLPPAH